jgi:large subunit ribosomal protein L23
MKPERLHQILVEPRISEKATRVADKHRQFVFRVLPDATKPEIKQAVESLFKVEVSAVQVLNVRARQKSTRRTTGVRPSWKKAYVTLQQGFDIDFMGAQ